MENEYPEQKAFTYQELLHGLEKQNQEGAAILRFIHYLGTEEEKYNKEGSSEKLDATWNYGRTSNQLLQLILEYTYQEGDEIYSSFLPLPEKQRYEPFSWFYYSQDKKISGFTDMRLIHNSYDNYLLLRANTSSDNALDGMEENFKAAFEKDPYPFRIESGRKTVYENPAYQALPKKT